MKTDCLEIVTAAVVTVLLAGVPAAAQTTMPSNGWPTSGAKTAAKGPAAAPARRISVPRAAQREANAQGGAARVSTPPVLSADAHPAASVVMAARPAAVVPSVPVPSTMEELVRALESQSALLARLATELEESRAIIRGHEQQITAVATKVAAPAPPAAPVAAPAPILVDTGGSKLRFGGLVQGWYAVNGGQAIDSFRLRRAEVKLSADIGARARWTVMLDPVKTTGGVLQDAFIAVQANKVVALEIGQQKVPLGLEGTQSSGKIDVVEKALFLTDKGRGAGYGDARDLGVMGRGKTWRGQIEIAAGLFNGLGESINDVDKDGQKAVSARVLYRPLGVKGLQVGGSAARGGLHERTDIARMRQGLELVYTRGRFTGKSEWMTGSDGPIDREGYYVQGGVRLAKAVETLFRVDSWDPDDSSEASKTTVTERDYIGGLNWQVVAPTVLLQANFIQKTFMGVQPDRSVFLVNLQTAW